MVDPANPVSKLRDLRDSIDNIDDAIVTCWRSGFGVPVRWENRRRSTDRPRATPEEKPNRSAVCGISRRSANSTPTLPRSSCPLSFMKSFGNTKRFGAEPPKVHLGVSIARPGLRDGFLRRRSGVAPRGQGWYQARTGRVC